MEKKKTYKAEYTCLNCSNKMFLEIDFGQSIPIFKKNVSDLNKELGIYESPVCSFCGCQKWGYGKFISQGRS